MSSTHSQSVRRFAAATASWPLRAGLRPAICGRRPRGVLGQFSHGLAADRASALVGEVGEAVGAETAKFTLSPVGFETGEPDSGSQAGNFDDKTLAQNLSSPAGIPSSPSLVSVCRLSQTVVWIRDAASNDDPSCPRGNARAPKRDCGAQSSGAPRARHCTPWFPRTPGSGSGLRAGPLGRHAPFIGPTRQGARGRLPPRHRTKHRCQGREPSAGSTPRSSISTAQQFPSLAMHGRQGTGSGCQGETWCLPEAKWKASVVPLALLSFFDDRVPDPRFWYGHPAGLAPSTCEPLPPSQVEKMSDGLQGCLFNFRQHVLSFAAGDDVRRIKMAVVSVDLRSHFALYLATHQTFDRPSFGPSETASDSITEYITSLGVEIGLHCNSRRSPVFI